MKDIRMILATTLFSCVAHKEEVFDNLTNDELVVNSRPQHYVVQLGREKGDLQLRKLADRGLLEEAWLFVDDERIARWYEIGVDEQKGSVSYDQLQLFKIIDELESSSIKSVSTYHIHPLGLDFKDKSVPSFPSMYDLANVKIISGEILKRNGELLLIYDGRIIDTNGLWVVSLDFVNLHRKPFDERFNEMIAAYKGNDPECSGVFPLEKSKKNDELAIRCSKNFAERLDSTAEYNAAFYSWSELKQFRKELKK